MESFVTASQIALYNLKRQGRHGLCSDAALLLSPPNSSCCGVSGHADRGYMVNSSTPYLSPEWRLQHNAQSADGV